MAYERVNWKDMETPVNAENLNHMDNQILENEIRVSALENAIPELSPKSGSTDLTTCSQGTFGNACTQNLAGAISIRAEGVAQAGLVASAMGDLMSTYTDARTNITINANGKYTLVLYGNKKYNILGLVGWSIPSDIKITSVIANGNMLSVELTNTSSVIVSISASFTYLQINNMER